MEINRLESAKFAQAADELLDKLEVGASNALAKSAAKGFPMAPGPHLNLILQAGQDTKGKIVEANGKIYDERRGIIFQEQEFYLKLVVRYAKLSFEAYQAELLNAIELEQAQAAAVTERSRADVERMNSETEARQVALIRNKAEVEQRIVAYKLQVVAAERDNLELERAVILAKLQTAEKKLEIINSLFQVLAAEQLVLAAEERKAASLTLVLAAQQKIAEIKREMVPFYIQKAEAREELATAITLDTEIRKELERLGYSKLELKNAEEYVDHLLRSAQEDHESAQEARIRAENATTLARQEARRLLQEYSNQVRASILAKKLDLEEDGVDFKLDTALARVKMGVDDDAEVQANEVKNLTIELQNLLANLEARALSQADTVEASGKRIEKVHRVEVSSRKIAEGVYAG